MNVKFRTILKCVGIPASELDNRVITTIHVSIDRYNFVVNYTILHQIVDETLTLGVFFLTNWLNTEESVCVHASNNESGAHYCHEGHGPIKLTTVLVKLKSEVVSVLISIKLVFLNIGAFQ